MKSTFDVYIEELRKMAEKDPVIGLVIFRGLKFGRLSNREAAADAVGDLYLEYLEKEKIADKEKNWSSWMWAWLTAKSQECARKLAIVPPDRSRMGKVIKSTSVMITEYDWYYTPDFYDGSDKVNEQVREALKILTPTQRRIVTLKMGLDGKGPRPTGKVAEITGMTVQSVWYHMQNVKKKLRPVLSKFKEYADV